jgi:hypothetical protein
VAYFIISTRPPTGAQEGTPKRHHRRGGEKTIIFCKKSSFLRRASLSILLSLPDPQQGHRRGRQSATIEAVVKRRLFFAKKVHF